MTRVDVLDKGKDCILVVEDEPDLLWATSQIFSLLGYKVYEASNAEAALKILEEGANINLVFTDISLPGKINGIELARMLKKSHPKIKIILTSGYPLSALRSAHSEIDEFEFFYKPYDFADIEKVITSNSQAIISDQSSNYVAVTK